MSEGLTPKKVSKQDKKIDQIVKKKLDQFQQSQRKEEKREAEAKRKEEKQERKRALGDRVKTKGELPGFLNVPKNVAVTSPLSLASFLKSNAKHKGKSELKLGVNIEELDTSARSSLDKLFEVNNSRDEVEQEEDSFLTALVVESEIEPAVKAVFESAKEKEYVTKLDQFVLQKEKEIEEICVRNYQGFISAADELLQVRTETIELKESIVNLNRAIQDSGSDLLRKYQRLLQHRRMLHNISLAMDLVQDCQYLMTLVSRVTEHISAREFYPALKNLNQLQRVHLPRVAGYGFVDYLSGMIPTWEEQIRKGSLDDLNNWLLSLRDLCIEIGRFALDQMEAQVKQEEQVEVVPSGITPSGVTTAARKIPVIQSNDFLEESLFSNKRFKMEFSSLYQCMHVYQALGMQGQFETLYRDNRKHQLNGMLKPKERVGPNGLRPYIQKLVGFFVAEMTVAQTSGNLMPRALLDKLWEQAVATIRTVLQEQISYTLQPETIFDLKEFMVLFTKTLQSFGYNVSLLLDFIDSMKETYIELSINRFNTSFIMLLESDKWDTLTINDPKEFDTLILSNRLSPPDNKKLPQTFQFSKSVPHFSCMIKAFIADFYRFGKNLLAVDDFVKKGTEKLIKMFTGAIMSIIEQSNYLSQLVQAWMNFSYLEQLCRNEWEDYLTTFSYHGKFKLSNTFDACRKQIEGFLHDLIKKKITDFILLAVSLNWTPSSLPTKSEPREYIQDLTMFLDNTFVVLNPLPTPLQESFQSKSISSVAIQLLELLTNDGISKYNPAGIKYLENDISYMESYAIKLKPSYADYFTESKQMLNLLLTEQMEGFMDANIRKSQYSKLTDVPKLVKILEKYKEESRFFKRKGAKEKSLEAVILHLRKDLK